MALRNILLLSLFQYFVLKIDFYLCDYILYQEFLLFHFRNNHMYRMKILTESNISTPGGENLKYKVLPDYL